MMIRFIWWLGREVSTKWEECHKYYRSTSGAICCFFIGNIKLIFVTSVGIFVILALEEVYNNDAKHTQLKDHIFSHQVTIY